MCNTLHSQIFMITFNYKWDCFYKVGSFWKWGNKVLTATLWLKVARAAARRWRREEGQREDTRTAHEETHLRDGEDRGCLRLGGRVGGGELWLEQGTILWDLGNQSSETTGVTARSYGAVGLGGSDPSQGGQRGSRLKASGESRAPTQEEMGFSPPRSRLLWR